MMYKDLPGILIFLPDFSFIFNYLMAQQACPGTPAIHLVKVEIATEFQHPSHIPLLT